MSEQAIRQLTSWLLDALDDEIMLDDIASSDLRRVVREIQRVNTLSARAEAIRLSPAVLRSFGGAAWAHAGGFSLGNPPPALDAAPAALQGVWLWDHGFTQSPEWLLREWRLGEP